jgi:hypothetical protein
MLPQAGFGREPVTNGDRRQERYRIATFDQISDDREHINFQFGNQPQPLANLRARRSYSDIEQVEVPHLWNGEHFKTVLDVLLYYCNNADIAIRPR